MSGPNPLCTCNCALPSIQDWPESRCQHRPTTVSFVKRFCCISFGPSEPSIRPLQNTAPQLHGGDADDDDEGDDFWLGFFFYKKKNNTRSQNKPGTEGTCWHMCMRCCRFIQLCCSFVVATSSLSFGADDQPNCNNKLRTEDREL